MTSARRQPPWWYGPWAFQVVLTALFLGLLVWRADLSGAFGPLREVDWRWLAAGFAVFPLTRIFDVVRWRLYLVKVGRVPLRELLGAFLVGNLVNNVLPMRVGDVVKIQIVANRHGLSRAGLAASRAVESAIDGATLLVVAWIALALTGGALVHSALLWTILVAVSAGLLAAFAASRLLPTRLPDWRALDVVPVRLRQVVDDALPNLSAGLETMRSGWNLISAVGLNLLSWGVQAAMFYALGEAFGFDVSLGTYLGVTIMANLVTIVPITFENIGPYEVLILEVLALQGVGRDSGVAYALASHAMTNAWVITLGFSAMWLMRLRASEVFAVRKPVTTEA